MEYLFPFLVGLAVGSFLNVCIYRIPKGESIVNPPSHCPYCQERIRWYDNIPVLSYLLLKGRCRHCGERIPLRYPLVELLSAVCSVSVVARFDASTSSPYYALLFWLLIVISFIDIATLLVPVRLCYFAMLAGFFFSFLVPEVSMADSFLGACVGASLVLFVIESYAVFTGKEGMGYGDANIMAMVGAFVGFYKVLLVMFLACVIGALVGLPYALLKDEGLKLKFPFAPFIFAGTFIAVLAGDKLISAYLSAMGVKW